MNPRPTSTHALGASGQKFSLPTSTLCSWMADSWWTTPVSALPLWGLVKFTWGEHWRSMGHREDSKVGTWILPALLPQDGSGLDVLFGPHGNHSLRSGSQRAGGGGGGSGLPTVTCPRLRHRPCGFPHLLNSLFMKVCFNYPI